MKKRMTAILLSAVCLVSVSASASGTPIVQPIDFADESVTINGSIGEPKESVRIIVANPGEDLGTVVSGEDLVKYLGETTADENGDYSFKIPLISGADAETGIYNVYVMSDSLAAPYDISFYYEKKSDRDGKITDINTKDEAFLTEHITEYIKAFGLDQFEALDDADAKAVAEALKIAAEFKDGDYIGVQECMKESAILDCYENGKTQHIYDNAYNPKYADLIGFDTMDSDYNGTFYKIFNEIMSNHGKKLVFDSLIGKSYGSYDELKKAFMKAVMLYSIANTKEMGSGHVSQIITANNAANVSMNAAEYLNFSNKGELNGKLVNIGNFSDISALERAISTAISDINAQDKGNGSGGNKGGGNSSPSRFDNLITAEPQITQPEASNRVFSDVNSLFWGVEEIEYLYNKNIISGFEDGSFKPNNSITREQAVKMLCVCTDSDAAEYNGEFTDVKSTDWFAPYISSAMKNGFITGRDNNTFGVGENVTREDFAVMLYRIIGEKEEIGEISFTDKDYIADYALEAVSYMSRHQIINGYEDGSFNPEKSLTRAEAAAVIYRYLKG